jgi:hypothetical protein
MKRLLVAILAVGTMASCASPLGAQSETPQQALVGAVQKMSQLQTAKFDLSGTVTMHLPPQLGQLLNQAGQNTSGLALSNLTIALKGNGEAQLPDRLHATIGVQMGGISVSTEEVVAAGKAYVRNPVSGVWTMAPATGGLSNEFSQPDPLTATQVLDTAKSVQDLGDTSLNGTTVHHYRLVPDKAKLSARLQSLPALKNNAQAQAAFNQILNNGTMTIEVWFGKDDHLVRRIVSDANLAFDLGQLMQVLGVGRGSQGVPPSSGTLPTGSMAQVTAHMDISYHDFNAPVTVTVPQVG